MSTGVEPVSTCSDLNECQNSSPWIRRQDTSKVPFDPQFTSTPTKPRPQEARPAYRSAPVNPVASPPGHSDIGVSLYSYSYGGYPAGFQPKKMYYNMPVEPDISAISPPRRECPPCEEDDYDYTEEYSDDPYVSESGEMDTSLLGRVIAGEIGRVLVWPTPPSQRSPYIPPSRCPTSSDESGFCPGANRTYTKPLNATYAKTYPKPQNETYCKSSPCQDSMSAGSYHSSRYDERSLPSPSERIQLPRNETFLRCPAANATFTQPNVDATNIRPTAFHSSTSQESEAESRPEDNATLYRPQVCANATYVQPNRNLADHKDFDKLFRPMTASSPVYDVTYSEYSSEAPSAQDSSSYSAFNSRYLSSNSSSSSPRTFCSPRSGSCASSFGPPGIAPYSAANATYGSSVRDESSYAKPANATYGSSVRDESSYAKPLDATNIEHRPKTIGARRQLFANSVKFIPARQGGVQSIISTEEQVMEQPGPTQIQSDSSLQAKNNARLRAAPLADAYAAYCPVACSTAQKEMPFSRPRHAVQMVNRVAVPQFAPAACSTVMKGKSSGGAVCPGAGKIGAYYRFSPSANSTVVPANFGKSPIISKQCPATYPSNRSRSRIPPKQPVTAIARVGPRRTQNLNSERISREQIQELKSMEAVERKKLQEDLRAWQNARRKLILDTVNISSSSVRLDED